MLDSFRVLWGYFKGELTWKSDKVNNKMQHYRKQRKLGCGAFIGSLFMICSISMVFKSYFCQLTFLSLESSIDAGSHIAVFKGKSFLQKLESTSKPTLNFCEIKGEIRVHGNSSTISIVSSQMGIPTEAFSWTVKPYVRKENAAAMELVKNWSVNSAPVATEFLPCDPIRSVPAILFSLGGFSGNHFHDFSDLLIPLYITSKQFNREVQFLVTDYKPWWIIKFGDILRKLSRYEIINLDTEEKIHCYQNMTIGLRYHKELGIDQSESEHVSMKGFRQFLRKTYSLKRSNTIRMGEKKPRLMIISRRNSRSFTNIEEITRMARSLGYKVGIVEPNISISLSSVAQTVNSCDVLLGIHGAGLTNMLFLADNAVVIQIVPLGSLDGLVRQYFGEPAVDMNLRYLEYKIEAKESSLIDKYDTNSMIIKDPLTIHKQGWNAVRSTYLDQQNVKLDVKRFRTTLLKALELLHQ